MQRAEAICGTLNTGDISRLKAELTTWDFSKEFGANASRFEKIFTILARANAALSETDKIEAVKTATKGDIAIADAMKFYHHAEPLQQNRTFTAMVTAIEQDLPNVIPFHAGIASHVEAVVLSTLADQAHVVAHANAAAAATLPQRQQQQQQNGGRGGRGRSGGRGGRTGGRGSPQLRYCFEHGNNPTHDGLACRVMAADPSYTQDMKSATHQCVLNDTHGRAWQGKA